LGIAANVAIFTFVDAALIRPLPYRDASWLVEVYDTRNMEVFTQFEASYLDFLDWREQQHPTLFRSAFIHGHEWL
jgi:macrolide transport system ATP-binding/permease protein